MSKSFPKNKINTGRFQKGCIGIRKGVPVSEETREKMRQVDNKDCGGRIEVHHILRWSDYPNLRYDVNNGITLCKLHHPRKKVEEIRMIPTFRELIF